MYVLYDEQAKIIMNQTVKGMKLWMGETGGAYGSGKNEVTNRFMFGLRK